MCWGVDRDPQPNYPGEDFVQGDALDFIQRYGHLFSVLTGGPPCQRKTKAQKIRGREHPALIGPTRQLFQSLGKPYVIENVVPENRDLDDDPLISPFQLCGCMFPELNVYRVREFESNVCIPRPAHQPHREIQTKMGRPPQPGERMHVVGNFSGVAAARLAMGIDWMTRDELREAIPPAYTRYIGNHLRTIT